jgi:hypothetical protein
MGGDEPPIFVYGMAVALFLLLAFTAPRADSRSPWSARRSGNSPWFSMPRSARRVARGPAGRRAPWDWADDRQSDCPRSRSVHVPGPRTHVHGLAAGRWLPRGDRHVCECAAPACQRGLHGCGFRRGLKAAIIPTGTARSRGRAVLLGGTLVRRQGMMRGGSLNCLGLAPFNGGRKS